MIKQRKRSAKQLDEIAQARAYYTELKRKSAKAKARKEARKERKKKARKEGKKEARKKTYEQTPERKARKEARKERKKKARKEGKKEARPKGSGWRYYTPKELKKKAKDRKKEIREYEVMVKQLPQTDKARIKFEKDIAKNMDNRYQLFVDDEK